MRLDQKVVEKFEISRNLSQKLIKSGFVDLKYAGQWQTVTKPSLIVEAGVEILIRQNNLMRFVSRAGLKLEGALPRTGLSVRNAICLDVGQSTGGFSDCLLQYGAARVEGVDVGHNQLHPQIRENRRVTCYEGINARAIPKSLSDHFQKVKFDVITIDVSFISQTLILPHLYPFLNENGTLISLVKPQFELNKEKIDKGGMVKKDTYFGEVENKIKTCALDNKFIIQMYFDSPIKGTDGNREYFIILKK